MTLRIVAPELFGVTEASATLTFAVAHDGNAADAPAAVLVDGVERARSEGGAGTRHVRVEGLAPDTEYALSIHVEGAPEPAPDEWFPGRFRTLPAPSAREVASFATLNDLHFGEPRFGGFLLPDGEYGEERDGWPAVAADDTEVPYWRFMNEDAIDEINAAGVDAAVIKGDIADRGRPEQFAAARDAFAKLSAPHHAFLGNHDYYARLEGEEVDGYALLGQAPAPRRVELGGWRLVLLETAEPGEHHGVFPDERLSWLEAELAGSDAPTLLFMHHHPVPPEYADSYPNTIGIRPEHSLRLFDLIGRSPQVQAVLIGHTHRNRARRHPAAGPVPFVEVNCTKDYPGGWAHYRLFEDGTFRQEVRRTASERALAHSTRCRDLFRGGYRRFALGPLAARCFVAGGRRARGGP